MREIVQALSAGELPILVGKPGCGKSSLVRKFVEAVAEGKYPEIASKQFFLFNTAEMVDLKSAWEGGNVILERLSNQMGRHRKDIVLIFDEFQAACYQNNPKSRLFGQHLKTRLEGAGDAEFPYVIALTTEDEFRKQVQQDLALERRFRKIVVPEITPKETKAVLEQMLLKQEHLWLSVEPGAIDRILQKAQELYPSGANPSISIKLLERCLATLEQSTWTGSELEQLEGKLRRKKIRQLFDTKNPPREEKIRDLEDAIAKLKQSQGRHEELQLQLQKWKQLLGKSRFWICRAARDCLALPEEQRTRRAKALFWVQQQLMPMMQQQIQSLGKALNIPTTLSTELVESVSTVSA
jgi:ATP-dependent Clp protease ATP-binding subunit ClpA